ncbi:type II toxin-antitoxin system HipA family toxin [Phaeobacter gallaeciensis]|uniref:HipA n=1 Tax=Phaeobacter gallaeciensis TaxID=60890 RepID=A0AAC9Z6G9_9RHOB|nr:type II toxin-antitoxin system HipA family toxin [Phaeobacter gallaeciensis]AHD08828.1 HipA [Phaeobacter gallaeciensis DSM 26640]ATE92094.1 HipA [Phaeobacter gallaeciensis]ATE98082.1 HipA [Phaeobacter gallaeciensis]ATF00710.1 HipA [Phaeobacter gallaeciensis]ATF05141.1 HipA [Phaeobacter gallaeciensis]
MGRKRSYTPLNVFLNSRLVGQLVREPSGGVSFAYTRDWLEWEHRMPVSLSLPLQENRYIGAPVMAVFDNLLPDSDLIRRKVAERVGAEGVDAFSLLSQIGRDCIGALQFLPDGQEPQPMSELTGEGVNEAQIGAILSDLDLAPLGIRRENDFRISVAGAQEKTALLRKDGQWIEPTGTTPTTHIIKPQIGRLPNGMDLSDSVENEYLCLKLMEAFGLRVANAEMAQFGEKKALVVERFDRRWTSVGRLIRLPQEDCCQALSVVPTQKYQNEGGPGISDIMDLLLGSDDPNKDRYDFFKANVLFWLLGATDGHGKNFSVSLLPGGRFRMTPLYDVLTVQPTVDARQIERKYFKLAMNFGNSNHYKVSNIVGRHIVETGVQSGLSRAVVQGLFEELQETSHAIVEATFNQLPADLPESLLASIDGALKARLHLLN